MLRDARITPKARGDVEDALLVLRDENVALKRKINTFEDRTKILTAKVQRLTDGFRRASNVDKHEDGLIDARDEDSFVDLRKRFDDVAKENMLLKKKVQYFKTMHEAETRKRVPYGHIPPRINTNQKKFHPALRIKDGGSPTPVTSTAQTATIPISNEEIEKLTNLVNSLRGKLNTAEADLDHHKSIGDEARAQLAKIQQRSDIELLSLQKENAQKGKAILDIRKELSTMDEKYRAMTEAYNRAVDTIDVLNDEVKGERGRVQILEETLKTQKMAAKREAELEEIIRDLRAEKEMLEVEQKRLLKFQFGRIREEELQQKIDDLQSSLLNVSKDRREWLDERGRLLRKIKELQDEHGAFAEDKKSGDALINQLKLELENATERLKLYEKNGQLDFSDIEEALAIIQLRKQKGITLDFLLQVEDHYEDKKLLHDLRQQFADCVQEVRTLRKMLKTQEQITKDVKLELNEKERELNGMKNEYELRLDELSRLLDTRAAKLAMLEAELKAISQKTFDVTPFSTEEVESGSDIKLEIGQNMFEVHIDSASISENILQSLKTDVSPNQLTTFIYFDFFDFETQLTPLGLGLKPHFNHTARFITDADNMLFKYLQSNPCLLHFCVSNGTKYEEIGVCRVTYMDLLALEKVERKRYYGEIVSIRDGTLVGKLDYSLLAYVPMSRAIEAYRERQHASRSLAKSSDLSITTGDFGALLHHSNELIITVEGCKSLRLSVDKERNIPAIYAMFQLFDLAPMFTDVVRGNNIQNPVFSLRKVVSLPVSMRLHQYLLEEELSVYVVAEKMSEGVGVVYGIARIKLSGLAFGHSLSGEFNLLDDYGVVCGTIMVQLKWGKSYQNPVDARREEETEIDHTRPPSPANEHPSPSNRFETSTEQGKSLQEGSSRSKGKKLKRKESKTRSVDESSSIDAGSLESLSSSAPRSGSQPEANSFDVKKDVNSDKKNNSDPKEKAVMNSKSLVADTSEPTSSSLYHTATARDVNQSNTPPDIDIVVKAKLADSERSLQVSADRVDTDRGMKPCSDDDSTPRSRFSSALSMSNSFSSTNSRGERDFANAFKEPANIYKQKVSSADSQEISLQSSPAETSNEHLLFSKSNSKQSLADPKTHRMRSQKSDDNVRASSTKSGSPKADGETYSQERVSDEHHIRGSALSSRADLRHISESYGSSTFSDDAHWSDQQSNIALDNFDDETDNVTMVITVERVKFFVDDQDVAEMLSTVQKLFVSFDFLDFPAHELESSPVSFAVHRGQTDAVVGFKKEFVLPEALISELRSSSPDDPNANVTFSVVSEPDDQNEHAECVDLALGTFHFGDLPDLTSSRSQLMKVTLWEPSDMNIEVGWLELRTGLR